MENLPVVTASMLASLVIELIKSIVRKVSPGFEFPTKFYVFLLPVLTFGLEPVMALIGFGEYALPTDWEGWAFQLVRVSLASLVSVALYENSVKPLKEKYRERKMFG